MSMQEEFDVLLNAFNKVIKDSPAVSKVKVELEDLIKAAEGSPTLNIRQKDAIIARCENYIAGKYGNTKTAEHLGHQKTA